MALRTLKNWKGAGDVRRPEEDRRYRELTEAIDRLKVQRGPLRERAETCADEVARCEEILIVQRRSEQGTKLDALTALESARQELSAAIQAATAIEAEIGRLTADRDAIEAAIKREQAFKLVDAYKRAIRQIDDDLTSVSASVRTAQELAVQIEAVLGNATSSEAAAIIGFPVDALYLAAHLQELHDTPAIGGPRSTWRQQAASAGLIDAQQPRPAIPAPSTADLQKAAQSDRNVASAALLRHAE